MSKSTKPAKSPDAAPAVDAAPDAAEAEAPKAKEAKDKTVKVKVLRSHPEYAYFGGDTAEISREAFDRIRKDGPFFEEL